MFFFLISCFNIVYLFISLSAFVFITKGEWEFNFFLVCFFLKVGCRIIIYNNNNSLARFVFVFLHLNELDQENMFPYSLGCFVLLFPLDLLCELCCYTLWIISFIIR